MADEEVVLDWDTALVEPEAAAGSIVIVKGNSPVTPMDVQLVALEAAEGADSPWPVEVRGVRPEFVENIVHPFTAQGQLAALSHGRGRIQLIGATMRQELP